MGKIASQREAMAKGIAEAIIKAHYDLLSLNNENNNIYIGKGNLHDASINRSPAAYNQNPIEERMRYTSNVDTDMIMLIARNMKQGKLAGVINWFPVHGVNMNKSNTLVSGDNKVSISNIIINNN